MKLSNMLAALTEKEGTYTIRNCSGNDRKNRPVDINLSPSPCADRKTCIEDPEIGSIHYRSQDVKPGGLFVAIPGKVVDGHDFIADALEKGAAAIIAQKPVDYDTIVIEVKNTRKAMAAVAAIFYGDPSKDMVIIGVTGTNGKTTVTYIIESIFLNAGIKTGVIGTINFRYAGKTYENSMTTPESLDLQRILADMRKSGITHVVMEISSHAVDLFRVFRCEIDVGAFLNLSQDHLDYHKDMESYWSCKKRMFTEFLCSDKGKPFPLAVINYDDKRGRELIEDLKIVKKASKLRVLKFSTREGLNTGDMLAAMDVEISPKGIFGEIASPDGVIELQSSMIGKHNLENILCGSAVGVALNLPLKHIEAGIADASCVPGRLEQVVSDTGKYVYVDYAHTPDAVEHVLDLLRNIFSGKMICVLGCGGDRDRGKRSRMGEIAGHYCDLAIITSDNPRTEEPMSIIRQIIEGVQRTSRYEYSHNELLNGLSKKGYVVESDRAAAIRLGIRVANPGDTVLIAGKGHETYQILGRRKIPFDDRREAEKALSELAA
jgi:UDP-N-acetylmuramoyl-L-alanyl-D-glutamate--2,6-diaminopimelate ligase